MRTSHLEEVTGVEVLALGWQLLLAIILLSAAWPKFRKFSEHAAVVKDYQMMPAGLAVPFARLEIVMEAAVGVMLLLGLWQKAALLAASGMLFLYTAAITVNLLRGRREISCGCGGAVGTHRLSWKLVARNVFFAVLSVWVLLSSSPSYTFGFDYWWTLLTAGAVLLLSMGVQDLWTIRMRAEAFFQQGEEETQSKGGLRV